MYRGLFRRVPLAALAIPAALMAGCGSDTTTAPRIVSIVAVSGLGQSGLVGANLTQPFVIRAEDQSGAPVEGEVIQWTVLTGGGTLTPSQSVTDANGRASTILRLGSAVGSQTVRGALVRGVLPDARVELLVERVRLRSNHVNGLEVVEG